MKEFVGVRYLKRLDGDTFSIKRDALIFNRIALPFILQRMREFKFALPSIVAELEWLIDSGLMFDPTTSDISGNTLNNEEFKKYGALLLSKERELKKIVSEKLNKISSETQMEWEKKKTLFKENRGTWEEYFTRAFCVELREGRGMRAYPILPNELHNSPASITTEQDVLQIVIHAMPVPDNLTSWEQILEYRSDDDSHAKFLGLRNWMHDVARNKLQPNEIEDKLEYLVNKYQQHMKLHKMKTNVGTLETIVVTTGDLLENFMQLKFGKVANAAFSFRRRRIALMEGEAAAPGNEIAYVVKARETFSSQNPF